MTVDQVLLIAAIICFVIDFLANIGLRVGNITFTPLGLALLAGSFLVA